MKNLLKNNIAFNFLIAVTLIIALSAFVQTSKWLAPETANAKKNPLTSDEPTIAAGKIIYGKECASCHGKKGKGDGPSAAALDVPVGDMSSPETQKQSDGSLFWKISEGRKPMPGLKKKLTETQIWQVVIYMRTLKTK